MKTLAPLPVPEAARGLAILRPLRPPIGKSEMVADSPDDSLRRAVERLSAAVVSEDAVALEFVARHGANVRYDHTARAWFVWDGARWKRDGTGLAFSWARALCRELALEDSPSARKSAGRAGFCKGVEEHATRDQSVSVTSDAWDSDPYLFGTPSGVVDLRSGVLRTAARDDLITG